MNEWINEKLLPPILKFVNTKAITALRNGMLYTMPFSIVGSIFLLLANFPVQSIADWVTNSGLGEYFNQAYGASFAIMAFFAVMGIAYSYVKAEGYEGLPAGMIGLLTMESSVTDAEANVTIANVIDKTWTGGQGMISAILVGLFVGWGYTWFLKRDIRIKLPEQVPTNVANSFTALIPAAVLTTIALGIYIFFDKVFQTTVVEWIYTVIQSPMQGVTDSLGGAMMLGFLVPFLWFFGVHGSTIVGGIMGPILQANSLANTAILESGKALTLENGGHIVTQQFLDQFMTVTGAGMTIGIVLYMVAFARSAQFKQLGRLSLIPAFFNINYFCDTDRHEPNHGITIYFDSDGFRRDHVFCTLYRYRTAIYCCASSMDDPADHFRFSSRWHSDRYFTICCFSNRLLYLLSFHS